MEPPTCRNPSTPLAFLTHLHDERFPTPHKQQRQKRIAIIRKKATLLIFSHEKNVASRSNMELLPIFRNPSNLFAFLTHLDDVRVLQLGHKQQRQQERQ